MYKIASIVAYVFYMYYFKNATIVAYAFYIYYFKNASIVAYAGLRVKGLVIDNYNCHL